MKKPEMTILNFEISKSVKKRAQGRARKMGVSLSGLMRILINKELENK